MFSILVGILASVLPNLFFGVFVMTNSHLNANKFIKVFYLGEGLKFVLLLLLLATFMRWERIQIFNFVCAFVAAQCLMLATAILLARRVLK